MTNTAKRIFAVSSSLAMALASFAPLAASAATHAAGTNVVSNGTVYFLDGTTKRPYTSAGAFLSYGFNSWSGVVQASAEDLALPTGSFVPPMDGSLINDKGTVYIITNGQRAGVTSAQNFLGMGYSFSNVMDGDTSFMASTALVNSTAVQHPVGTLVNDNGTVFLITASGKMGIPSLSVFNSWGYSFKNVVAANSYDKALPMSSGIMQTRQANQLNPTDQGGTVPLPPVTGSVSVSAASSNPASTTLVLNQSLANLADFTFYGNGTVTSVTLKRLGISSDNTLSNVFLFDGANRITDAASVSSGSLITFSNPNGLFTVSGSKTVSVKADVAATGVANSGETVGIQLVSAATGSTAVGGTPVTGNLHTIAAATLATAVFANSPTASGSTNPGTDVLVWQDTLTVGTRDVLMTRLALRQIQSINSADVRNFRLYIDGVQVASQANLDANGYVTFQFSKALTTGTRVVRVVADVIGGSGRNIQMSLRGAYDVTLTDTQYNAGVKATVATGAFPITPTSFSVSSGTLTVVKASDSQSSNVTLNGSDVSLGKWTFTAYGEPVKVETLNVGVDTSLTDTNVTLRNVRVLVNGAQVGSTTSVAAEDFGTVVETGTSFTTNFVVNPGSPAVVEVRGDLYDNEGSNDIVDGTTLQVELVAGSSNAIPQNSLSPLGAPSSSITANTLTVAAGSLALAKESNYANQTIVNPQTAFKIADFNLTASNTEDVNVNTLTLTWAGDSADTFTYADLTDVYLKYGNQTTAVKSTISSSETFSVSLPVAKNTVVPVEVYANVNATGITAGDTLIGSVAVSATTASGQTANVSATTGQTITTGSGSITATKDASSPDSKLVDDGSTVTTAAFRMAAVNDTYTVTDVTFTIADASNVVSVNLKDGSTVVASKPGATAVTFSGLNISVPANTNKVLTTELVLGTVGTGAGTSGASILTTLTAFTARNSQGTSAAGTESDPAGNAMYVYKAVPTLSSASLATNALVAGASKPIFRFSVNTNGTGNVAWKQIMLEISKSAAVTVSSPTLWNADTGTQITAATAFQNGSSGVATTCSSDNTSCELLLTVGTNASDNVEEQVSGAKTYEVRATIGGTLTSGLYLSTTMDANSSHISSTTFQLAKNAGTANSASFVWSDMSAQSHGTGTSDWTNDNLVKMLPISHTLTY
jgi:hypothetical protein